MSTDSPQPAQPSQNELLYEFSIYPFSTDLVFQEGLQSIISLTHGKSPEELEDIISQAKVFYFARTTGHKVTWENYLEWQKSRRSLIPDSTTVSPEVDSEALGTSSSRLEERDSSTQLTLQQITDLIKRGQTHLIPNNKVIPETLHSDAPSESTQVARKKPWEQTQRIDENSDEHIMPQIAAGSAAQS